MAVHLGRQLGLVLGGGGIAGIAWHTGVLRGLAESGIDLSSAERLVGTSAGATVAVQVGAGCSVADLFDRQVDPASLATELTPHLSVTDLWERMAPIYTDSADDAERRLRLGRLALEAETVDEAVRRRVIAARLDGLDWAGDRVSVVAVEAATGRRRVFDGTSGVDVVDAVAASCAVPGVWPPVTIDGARYVDGGIWSITNSDLAPGCTRVVVLAPIPDQSMHAELAGLGDGVATVVVTPDDASRAAFGTDVLDPAVREPSARAGLAQGRAEAPRLAVLFDD
ncbi:MAG TPA: patatin-like phospholipase family protein [Acidimicrobiales bacterium]